MALAGQRFVLSTWTQKQICRAFQDLYFSFYFIQLPQLEELL